MWYVWKIIKTQIKIKPIRISKILSSLIDCHSILQVLLGSCPEDRLDEPAFKQMVWDFKAELSNLGEEIATTNTDLVVPYTYLHPDNVKSSAAI